MNSTCVHCNLIINTSRDNVTLTCDGDYIHKTCLEERNNKEEDKLLTIDLNLIKELRLQGRYGDARRLLKAHKESIIKEKKIGRQEFITRDAKIVRFQNRKRGLCYLKRDR